MEIKLADRFERLSCFYGPDHANDFPAPARDGRSRRPRDVLADRVLVREIGLRKGVVDHRTASHPYDRARQSAPAAPGFRIVRK